MDTVKFLERVLPSQGVYLVAVKSDRFRHYGFESFTEMAEYIAQHDGDGDVYHACAAYLNKPTDESARKKDNWKAAKAFWVDIDCGLDKAAKGKGYETQQGAAHAIAEFCQKCNLPAPMIISSGYGIHCYWTLTSAISPEQWIPYAGKLKILLAREGVLQDPSRTSDFASILRPVGSTNKKRTPHKIVKCVFEGRNIETQEFLSNLDRLIPADPLAEKPSWLTDSGDDVNEVLEHLQPDVEYDADVIAERCAVVKLVKDTKGDASYETWRKVIGMLTFCKNGEQKAEEWTANRRAAGHAQTNWRAKFATWTSPPPRCDKFKEENPQLCKNCPYKVNTPLMLGRALVENKPVELPKVEDKQLPSELEGVPQLPKGFQWDAKHHILYIQKTGKDGTMEITPFCNTLFYPIGRLCNADSKFLLPIRMHLPDGKTRDFDLSAGSIGRGGATLMEELAEHEIYATTDKGAEAAMASYLKEQAENMKNKVSVTRVFTNFGWQDDEKSFLIGDRLYEPGGKLSRVALRGYALARQNMYPDPVGTLEDYSGALNWIYNNPGMEPMQYAIASLWAAPLSVMVDPMYKGIPCALTGAASGKGKTTAFTAALYAYGDASAGMATVTSKTGSTTKAKLALMGCVSNLPILFDEFTNISPKEMSDMAYSLANGSDVIRLQARKNEGITFADASTWNTHTGLTGNTNLIACLSEKGKSEAEAMRLFEIRIDNFNTPVLDPIKVAAKLEQMSKNMGQAGEAFIRFVVDNKPEVENLLTQTSHEVSQDLSLAKEPKYRFYRYHMICTITAAKIMNKLGVTSWDIDKLVNFARKQVTELCTEVIEAHGDDPEELLSQYMLDNVGRTLVTSGMKMSAPVPFSNREIVSRAIFSPEGGDSWNNRYITSTAAFSNWCYSNRIDPKALLNNLEAKKCLLYKNVRKNLLQGTSLAPVKIRVHIFDTTNLDVHLEDENGN